MSMEGNSTEFIPLRELKNSFQEIRAVNVTIKAENLISLWPSGDYRVYITTEVLGEEYLNITFIATFITQLKESFG